MFTRFALNKNSGKNKVMTMDTDTQRISGGFRTIETKIRMLKERRDNTKHTDKKFYEVLNLLTTNDGFTTDEIAYLKAVNKVSGSMAHGNYAEAMTKMDESVIPVYFSSFKPRKGKVSKVTFGVKATGDEILDAIFGGKRETVEATPQSDIFEAYLSALAEGYIGIMDQMIKKATDMVDVALNKN
jgi:hypothetical protein